MLSIQDARLLYGSKVAFSGFSLEVQKGEMVSIIGKSGCGKTSLLYAIASLLPLNGGTITTEGECAIMFQQDRLLPYKRAIDNVLLGLPKQMRGEAEALLALVGLKEKMSSYPKQLSGGERQRVALARSLIRKPGLLLLDEPFASLDEQTRERLQDEVKAYVKANNITLVLVTHSIAEAVFMGSRIVVMTEEGIVFETTNPYHELSDLRIKKEAFELQRILRSRLGGNR
ncbi:MAG TPA: sulfonate ABC transporter ATP-binding protein [Sphaerochaeta sp.]|jgi:ABC-type nitrate/sulfonate/bicarbonate transport system ATPase subunit|nr:sulfonate ABC transporter ATP-binding protein [Sphaerochaeta sp.]